MRIAVSGSHCCGKTTLVDEFLPAHPEFAHEPEPYTVLQEDHGEVFSDSPSLDDFFRQLNFSVERLRACAREQQVIFERSPADFLAYMLGLKALGRENDNERLVERSLDIVREAVPLLDLIVFLPINGIAVPADEDPKLRRVVNDRLEAILINDEFDLFAAGSPRVLEAGGTTAQRLAMVERAVSGQ
jgi:hypothetical protein